MLQLRNLALSMRRVAFVLLVLIAAGCGGGSRLSKTDYAKRADAICSKYNAKINALGRPGGIKALPSYVDRALPIWYRAYVEPRSGRTLALDMTAAAHFMRDDYVHFGGPRAIFPPRR